MQSRAIERHDIENLLPLFKKNYPKVSLSDELTYFDEETIKDWYIYEENFKILGFIRHFPDLKNDFSVVEYYFEDTVKEESAIHELMTFCRNVSQDIKLRLNLRISQKRYIEECSKVLPKRVQFSFYEMELVEVGKTCLTKLSSTNDTKKIIKILKHFGEYDETNVASWIDNKNCYSFFKNNQLAGACYTRPQKNEIEIEMMALSEESRGEGQGKVFLKELLILFKQKGYKKVFLKVQNTNLKAIKLYKTCGMNLVNEKIEVWLYSK